MHSQTSGCRRSSKDLRAFGVCSKAFKEKKLVLKIFFVEFRLLLIVFFGSAEWY